MSGYYGSTHINNQNDNPTTQNNIITKSDPFTYKVNN